MDQTDQSSHQSGTGGRTIPATTVVLFVHLIVTQAGTDDHRCAFLASDPHATTPATTAVLFLHLIATQFGTGNHRCAFLASDPHA
jgi:hypothetical protein